MERRNYNNEDRRKFKMDLNVSHGERRSAQLCYIEEVVMSRSECCDDTHLTGKNQL